MNGSGERWSVRRLIINRLLIRRDDTLHVWYIAISYLSGTLIDSGASRPIRGVTYLNDTCHSSTRIFGAAQIFQIFPDTHEP